MIATRGLGAGFGAVPSFGMGAGISGAPPTPTPTGSKGRRLVRWVINSPPIPNPLGEYVWRREEEDEFYIVFG